MKIFVAFGYNPRDRWIPELVFPIIKAFGDEVVSGEEIPGQQITDAIIREIRQSHALLAFTTRRDKIGDQERWTTHRWVTDELSQALAPPPLRVAAIPTSVESRVEPVRVTRGSIARSVVVKSTVERNTSRLMELTRSMYAIAKRQPSLSTRGAY